MGSSSRIYYCLALLSFCLITASAQATLDSDDFFQKVIVDWQIEGTLTGDFPKFPWVEEYVFRTETRDFNFDEQEYTLRVSPSTPKKRKAQAALRHHYYDRPNQEYEKRNLELAANLYVDWLDLYFIEQEKGYLTELSEVWNDKKTINEKLIGTFDFDFDDLVQLETESTKLEQTNFRLELEQNELQDMYGIESDVLDHSDLVTMEEILTKLAQDILTETASGKNGRDQIAYKREGVEKEIALEEAEGRQIFDFAQLRYRGPHEDLYRERIAVGIGFKLPNSGNRKLKIAELQAELQELNLETNADTETQALKISEAKDKLITKIKLAQNYSRLIEKEEVSLQNLGDIIQKKSGFNPLLILDINEKILESKIKELDYKEEVYFDYIKYLALTGQLTSAPFINYLKA